MSGAFDEGELDHLPDDKARRLRRMFNFTPPLDPLDRDEWPYEYVPGEAWPIDGQLPVEMEELPEVRGRDSTDETLSKHEGDGGLDRRLSPTERP